MVKFNIAMLWIISVIVAFVVGGDYYHAVLPKSLMLSDESYCSLKEAEIILPEYKPLLKYTVRNLLYCKNNGEYKYFIDGEGNQYKLKNNMLHNFFGPSMIHTNGVISWYQNGLLHREGGLPAVVAQYYVEWYTNGELNNVNGPAFIWWNGAGSIVSEWYVNGQKHRADGPAVINSNGYKEWWINGKFIKSYSNGKWQYK